MGVGRQKPREKRSQEGNPEAKPGEKRRMELNSKNRMLACSVPDRALCVPLPITPPSLSCVGRTRAACAIQKVVCIVSSQKPRGDLETLALGCCHLHRRGGSSGGTLIFDAI